MLAGSLSHKNAPIEYGIYGSFKDNFDALFNIHNFFSELIDITWWKRALNWPENRSQI